jgi:hypothetical protein
MSNAFIGPLLIIIKGGIRTVIHELKIRKIIEKEKPSSHEWNNINQEVIFSDKRLNISEANLITLYYYYYYYYYYSAFGPVWQEPEPSQPTGMALVRCVLGKFLGVGCHCIPLPLDVLTFAARCPHVLMNTSAPSSERWNYRARNGRLSLPVTQLPCNLLHAANLRHGDLRIFSPEKIRRLRPGLNPRTRVPEASMLTTRPPKPTLYTLLQYFYNILLCRCDEIL